MKPIFKEEKEFLEKKLNIVLPENCWRNSSKVYLNADKENLVLQFKAEMEEISIVKYNVIEIKEDTVVLQDKKNIKEVKNLSIEEEYELRKEYLENLLEESVHKTIEAMQQHPDHQWRISVSGGKDSDLTLYVVKEACKRAGLRFDDVVEYDVFNTTNDTAQTYLHIKNTLGIPISRIHTPKMGWYQWLKEVKNWFIPSVLVRNCCSTFKEGKLKDVMDKKTPYLMFLGMRKYESVKRSKYDWYLNDAMEKEGTKLNVPKHWVRFLPIVEFKDEDVWLTIIHLGLPYNKMYEWGYNRCGCLICPYASDYIDMITKERYPHLYNRWMHAVKMNYETYFIGRKTKWTLEEWQKGKWKQGKSKENEIVKLVKTSERVKQLAEIKGISEEVAAKYWDRKCSCGKKLNTDEIAMFLKAYGRYEGKEDNRTYKCKGCLCNDLGWTPDEYKDKVIGFREQECNLF